MDATVRKGTAAQTRTLEHMHDHGFVGETSMESNGLVWFEGVDESTGAPMAGWIMPVGWIAWS